jgi:hypothetical protein
MNEAVCAKTCYGLNKGSASCDYGCFRYKTCLYMQQVLSGLA